MHSLHQKSNVRNIYSSTFFFLFFITYTVYSSKDIDEKFEIFVKFLSGWLSTYTLYYNARIVKHGRFEMST